MTRSLMRSMKRPRRHVALIAAAVFLAMMASLARADAPPGPHFNGFEVNTSNWFDSFNGGDGSLSRQQSGYTNGGYASGINSATDDWHARISGDPCVVPVPCFGPFTRWGGYTDTFPIGGYRTRIAIYLDVSWARTHPDARFDFSSAVTDSAGGFLRDFVFNAGTNRTIDPGPAGFYVNASTNAFRSGAFPENPCPAPSAPPNVCRAPVHITTSGWYTFRQTFRDAGGSLAVDFDIFNDSGGSVAGWTIYSGDQMSTVGGNRYGWFANEEIPDLAIDDSARTGLNLALSPATATNFVGGSHTVTATVSSTDSAGRPSAGPGVPVEFDVISGPNAGQTSHPANTGTCSPSNCTTDSAGNVSWTYASSGQAGTDTIRACFPERSVVVQRMGDEPRTCHTVTKTWQASTPGKVTGGGQIQGDPLFSPLGALLSVPAVIPSLAGLPAQSTFGFVVTCCPAQGNLEYEDHVMDVRIKATSIDHLVISDGQCGSNTHATFDGTATVTRSIGSTTEQYTAQADDCGEPGTSDQFGIKTDTYSNGPSTLIGGNIQIHKS
jgi:hypothetical protein